MRCYKKAMFRIAITGTLAIGSLAMGLVTAASAGCPNLPGFEAEAVQPMSWRGTGELGSGPLLLIADRDDSVDPIVGFWRVTYVLPGGTGLGFQQWHSDGTEIHNADAPAAKGNVCLGVWKKTGKSHYTLNHFFLDWDPATDTLNARIQLREEIDLDHGSNEHFGTVTFDVDDLNGHLTHIQGTVQAARITVKTDLKDLF
jgi:hypothetical protein